MTVAMTRNPMTNLRPFTRSVWHGLLNPTRYLKHDVWMAMDRSRLLTAILLVAVIVLLGQVFWQQRRIQQLQFSMEFQQRQFEQQAAKLATDMLRNRRSDVLQAAQWLHGYYASDEGLRRADGLWRADQKQPDFEALGAWIFDVYLNARVEGKTEEEARQMIKDAIQSSDEWRRIHETPKK
jgi:hypothetical protein